MVQLFVREILQADKEAANKHYFLQPYSKGERKGTSRIEEASFHS